MSTVYIVETSSDFGREIYPAAYATYDLALAVVKRKHRDVLDEDRTEPDPEMKLTSPADFNAPENPVGRTELFIERDKVHISIIKLSVNAAVSGGRYRKRMSRRHTRSNH